MSIFSKNNILEWLYSFDSIRGLKHQVRPLKHVLLGKSGIYYVLDEIAKARGANSVKVIFDIGAAVGDTALTLGTVFRNAEICCFEPQRESMDRLKRRTVYLGDRIKTFQVAFMNKKGEMSMNILSYADASSFLPVKKYFSEQGINQVEQRIVTVETLDDFVKDHHIAHIDFMKIDVEGVEKELLEGGSETLRSLVDNVYIEISPLRKGPNNGDHVQVFQFFQESGFTFIGYYGDYFFSKDKMLLEKYFKDK